MTATSERRWQPAGAGSPLPCTQRRLCAAWPFPWLSPSTFFQGCSPSRTHRQGGLCSGSPAKHGGQPRLRHQAGAACPRGQGWGQPRSPGASPDHLAGAERCQPLLSPGRRGGDSSWGQQQAGGQAGAEGSGGGGQGPRLKPSTAPLTGPGAGGYVQPLSRREMRGGRASSAPRGLNQPLYPPRPLSTPPHDPHSRSP